MRAFHWENYWLEYYILIFVQTYLFFGSYTAYLGRNEHSIIWMFDTIMVHHDDVGDCAVRWDYYRNLSNDFTYKPDMISALKQALMAISIGIPELEYPRFFGMVSIVDLSISIFLTGFFLQPCPVSENFISPEQRFFSFIIMALTLMTLFLYHSVWLAKATIVLHSSYLVYAILCFANLRSVDPFVHHLAVFRVLFSIFLFGITLYTVSLKIFGTYLDNVIMQICTNNKED